MRRGRELRRVEPAELVELVRLADPRPRRVETHGEDDRHPVRSGTQHIPYADLLDAERSRRVLLGDLAGHRLLERLPELQRAGSAIPGAGLVAGRRGTAGEQNASGAVVADEDDGDRGGTTHAAQRG